MAFRLRKRQSRSIPCSLLRRVSRSSRLSRRDSWFLFLLVILLERLVNKVDWSEWWESLPDDKSEAFWFILENWWNAEGGPPFPYKGAKDEYGGLGYVHDVSFLEHRHLHRHNQLDLDIKKTCEGPPYGQGIEGSNGFLALNKIKINNNSPSTKNNITVLCIVYTHSNRHDVLQSILETWAVHCDGFMAASNTTDRILGAVNILHAGPESYGNMWQKVRSTWAYVYHHYLHRFQYFHIGGDNMFLMPQNLKLALLEANHSPNHPLLLGGAFIKYPNKKKIYCGGGSGYTLNRPALQQLIENQFHTKTCYPYHVTSGEDIMIASCLHRVTKCRHAIDPQNRTRYFPLSPDFHATWTNDQGGAIWYPQELLAYHQIQSASRERLDSISSTAVSFHLTQMDSERDSGMRRLYGIVYNKCHDWRKDYGSDTSIPIRPSNSTHQLNQTQL